ncbi:MAG: DNA mismatch repair endonuclease MutL [Ruminococcus sp.]|nr:DNA mismatch repair endonuclease MutL [Ruminococcus sp.]
MGRINILDKHTAELIAAGEVVERPSSVIKELVENSIDAGATAVTVEIKNGGVTFMRVSDNGSGILRDDVRPAFIRHATSKVKAEEDLDCIATLGFRGEALCSVSSVSHLELLTKAREEEIGTRCLIDGGEERLLEDAGCPTGTTIIVRDLFYNVPARMKFLKTDLSEGNAVSNVIDKIALSHPEVAITYIKDSKPALKTSGDGKLLSAIYAVYGRDFANALIPVSYELNGVKVEGYVSRPENARSNRNMQNFFINHRYVICKTAMAAIGEACKGSVMIGKFPSCVINIDMSFSAVDVNVHPTKLEVRFLNERPVFDAVYHAVKSALLNGEKRIEASLPTQKAPAVNPFELYKKTSREKEESKKTVPPTMIRQSPVKPSAGEEKKPTSDELFSMLDDPASVKKPAKINLSPTLSDSADPFEIYSAQAKRNEEKKQRSLNIAKADKAAQIAYTEQQEVINETSKLAETPIEDPKPLIETDDNYYRFVGEAFKTYIIIEKNPRELMLIDKHAAHERMIFEKLKRDKGSGSSQLLLEPITLTLNKIDYDNAIMNKDVFIEAGFDIDSFGTGMIIIRSAPQYLSFDDIALSVEEMAGYLTQNKKEIRSEKMEWIYHNVSCRAAIKGGDFSTDEELIELAKRVEDEDIRHCPHGRPVCVILKKRELEKQFGRIV